MFNETYGLQRAAIDGTKPMTRRLISNKQAIYSLDEQEYIGQLAVSDNFVKKYSRYQVGEVVAIAQSYKDVLEEMIKAKGGYGEEENEFFELYKDTPGWKNKMFVKADLMPHRIRITDLKIERLQDISDEDCMKEGIIPDEEYTNVYRLPLVLEDYINRNRYMPYHNPREAFAVLIDKVSGRGTWVSNPWVFAYSFELFK